MSTNKQTLQTAFGIADVQFDQFGSVNEPTLMRLIDALEPHDSVASDAAREEFKQYDVLGAESYKRLLEAAKHALAPTVYVTVGVPASGKTTWAEEMCANDANIVNVNRDDARQELFGPFKWGEYKFTDKNEKLVTKTCLDRAMIALTQGKSVIISDTNLYPEFRSKWASIATEFGAKYEEVLFHINYEVAAARDAARDMTVGKKILTNMLQKYHNLNRDLIVKHFKEKLEAAWADAHTLIVLSDIDGTVAEMHKGVKGKRSPFEWLRVGEDTPRPNVLFSLSLYSEHYPVWFMSGRDGVCESHTTEWLKEHAPFYTGLVMRKPSDSRPDWVIKLELLLELAEMGIKPVVMFDDRDQVVNTLREVGVEVWQVQPGNF